MSQVVKYVVLAIIGFGIGAGAAWMQTRNEAPQAVQAPAAGGSSDIVPGAPPAPTEQEVMAPVVQAEAPAAAAPPPQNLPVAGAPIGGAFTLTDFNGQPVTEKSWPGQYKMVFFGFTYCPDICPAAVEKMSTALKNLGADAAKVQPLMITIDPGRDTPEKLKAFFSNYEGNFVGLTGTEDQIRHVKGLYKAYAAKVPGASEDAYLMDHSAYVYFMSPEDTMLEIFGSSSTPESMAQAISGHLATKAQ